VTFHKVLRIGGIDHLCERCERIADWRARDAKTGDVISSACKAHKDAVRADLIVRLFRRQS
jgi:hypothetical protein